QAEDGIRDDLVTGVQTCALPILWGAIHSYLALKEKGQIDHNYLVMGPWRHSQVNGEGYGLGPFKWDGDTTQQFRRDVLKPFFDQIGRASCRERGETCGVGVRLR